MGAGMTLDGGAARILVVDDLEANCQLLASLLTRAGYQTIETETDPAAALASVRADPPDLILVDVHMPAIDGIEFVRTVRADLPDAFLPIVVVTADVGSSVRREALDAGATDFLTKPFDVTEVRLRVRNLVQLRAMHLALEARAVALAEDVETRTRELEEHSRDRLDVARSLVAPRAGGGTAGAASLVTELVERRGFSSAAIVGFIAGRLEVVAAEGVSSRPLDAMDGPFARALAERAAQGPWVEPGTVEAIDRSDASASVVGVPLHVGSSLVGVLLGELTADLARDAAGRLPVLLEYGAVAAASVGPGMAERQQTAARRNVLLRVIADGAFTPVFHPIVNLRTGETVGYEALTRFADGTPPDERFAESVALGIGSELEIACLTRSIRSATKLPHGTWLSVNLSPGLVRGRENLAALLDRADRPVVLEVTESAPIDDYAAFRELTQALGHELAVDDAGAGYASLRHIVELMPQYVKIDMGLVRDVDTDPSRQALVVALDHFALRAGMTLIAEGIETQAEREALEGFGVELGQGYLFGRPHPAPGR